MQFDLNYQKNKTNLKNRKNKYPYYMNHILLKLGALRNCIKEHRITSVLDVKKASYYESEIMSDRNPITKEDRYSLG